MELSVILCPKDRSGGRRLVVRLLTRTVRVRISIEVELGTSRMLGVASKKVVWYGVGRGG